MYTIKRQCVEEPDMLLFLVDSKDENATDENLQRLNGMLKSLKANKKVGEHFMHTYMREQHIREEAMEKGMEKGQYIKLINQVCRKLQKGKSPDDIVNELEEDISLVQKICDALDNCGNRYDEEEIYDELTKGSDTI